MIKRGQVWMANLDPGRGTEPGKIRPVVVIQTDFLNQVGHPLYSCLPFDLKAKTRKLTPNTPFKG
ncbi:MAG: type II toxin-antitoxin system PemK/MazF family toxin [Bacteroidota bacterium]